MGTPGPWTQPPDLDAYLDVTAAQSGFWATTAAVRGAVTQSPPSWSEVRAGTTGETNAASYSDAGFWGLEASGTGRQTQRNQDFAGNVTWSDFAIDKVTVGEFRAAPRTPQFPTPAELGLAPGKLIEWESQDGVFHGPTRWNVGWRVRALATVTPAVPLRADLRVAPMPYPYPYLEAPKPPRDGWAIVGSVDGVWSQDWTGPDLGWAAADAQITGDAALCVSVDAFLASDPMPLGVAGVLETQVAGGAVGARQWYTLPRFRVLNPSRGMWNLRQRQSLTGNAGGWPLRQRQTGGATGSWPLRQRQTGT